MSKNIIPPTPIHASKGGIRATAEDPTVRFTPETGAGDITRAESAIASIRAGLQIVVTDDDTRENEGDLVMAADAVTAEDINFMITHGRGLVCIPLLGSRLDELGLPEMAKFNTDPLGTNFSVSVDLDLPGSTGISAPNRAATIRSLVQSATARDLRRPGHVFPLRYTEGGVLSRRGHTEASIDVAVLAGRAPAAVICEILAPNGEMLRGAALADFAAAHDLCMVSIEEIARYRRGMTTPVAAMEQPNVDQMKRDAETVLPTTHGTWRAICYAAGEATPNHLALVMGDPTATDAPLVRVHSECLTGDVFGSERCDCGVQLDEAMRMIAREKVGVIVYVRGHEGRGIGLIEKVKAYALQDRGYDTVDANLALGLPVDARDYDQSVAILRDLGLARIRLMTNNPAKVESLARGGISTASRVSIPVVPNRHNAVYINTKMRRLGHHAAAGAARGDLYAVRSGDSRIVG